MTGARLLEALAGPALLLLAGAGIVPWVPELRALSRPARLAAAYLVGAATVGCATYLLSWALAVPVGRGLFLTLAAIGAARALVAEATGAHRRARPGAGLGAPGLAFGILLTTLLLGYLGAALADPVTDFDGRMTWGTQARFVRHDASVLPEALRDDRVYVIHPRYPLLLPILQVAAVEVPASSWDDASVQFLYGLFLPALALLLAERLRPTVGAIAAVGGCSLVALAPALAWGLNGGALSTYSDLPLAAFLGGALSLLASRRLSPGGGAVAGLLLAAAVLSKQEGAILAGALAAAALWPRLAGPRSSAGSRWLAAAGYLLAIGVWLAWRSAIPNRNDEGYLEGLLAGVPVATLAERVVATARGAWATLVDWPRWGALWVLLTWAALAFSRRWTRTRLGRVALCLLAAHAALALVAYASAPRADVVAATLGRFLIQASAPCAVLLALSIREAR